MITLAIPSSKQNEMPPINRLLSGLNEPISVNELQKVQEPVYYPCEWETAKQVYNFMVDEYEMQQDLWWQANRGTLI